MYKTWLYFVGITIITLTIFWVSEILFFRALFRRTHEETLVRSSESVVDSFNGVISPEYQKIVENTAKNNSMVIMLFTTKNGAPLEKVTSDEIVLLLYQDPMDREPTQGEFVALDEQFVAQINKNKNFSYRHRTEKMESYVFITGAKTVIGGKTIYFYTASSVAPVRVMIMPFNNQFIIVTCICIILSVIISFGFSTRLTRPISEFAKTAMLLGKGKKVEFKESGIEEYDKLALALNYSSEELVKTEKMRRDFVANVSHDLRTPLTMVKAYAEMIRDISGDNEQKRNEHCKVIIDEVDRLTLLVGDLLDLSKIQAGTRQPELKKVDVTALIRGVMERFAMYAEREGYNFELDIDENCLITADERMVEQICYNLISNAVSYTGEDKKVAISLKNEGNEIIARISDTGKGIEPDEVDKVWDRYYRTSQSKRAVVGSGIGLSIVKSLLEVHGARYGIDSAVGKGTTFWFALKRADE